MINDKSPKVHPIIKERLGFNKDDPDEEVLRDWHRRVTELPKPCEKYNSCLFDSLTEKYPFLPSKLSDAIERYEFFKAFVDEYSSEEMDLQSNFGFFQSIVDRFNPEDHPEEIPEIFVKLRCKYYGYICPIYFCYDRIKQISVRI